MIWCIPKNFLRRHILCVIATILATGYSSSSLSSFLPAVHFLSDAAALLTTAVAVVKTAVSSVTAAVAKTTATITAAATNT